MVVCTVAFENLRSIRRFPPVQCSWPQTVQSMTQPAPARWATMPPDQRSATEHVFFNQTAGLKRGVPLPLHCAGQAAVDETALRHFTGTASLLCRQTRWPRNRQILKPQENRAVCTGTFPTSMAASLPKRNLHRRPDPSCFIRSAAPDQGLTIVPVPAAHATAPQQPKTNN